MFDPLMKVLLTLLIYIKNEPVVNRPGLTSSLHDPEQSMTECLKQRREKLSAMAESGRIHGQFIPKCDELDGTFLKRQYHSSTGKSWCVHPTTGEAITKPLRGDSLVTCECLVQLNQAEKLVKLLGKFSPSCEADGTFSKIQNHPSTGLSWCVDPLTGNLLTRKLRKRPTSCDCVLLQQKDEQKDTHKFGKAAVKCEPDGSFSPMQRHSSTGHTWCVDPETGVAITQKSRNVLKSCECLGEKFLTEKKKDLVGVFVPRCEEDGTFSNYQSNPSTGQSWCVDPLTGLNVTASDMSTTKENCKSE